MNLFLEKIHTVFFKHVPKQYKNEVEVEFLSENYSKMSIISIILFFLEVIIYINDKYFFDVGIYILPFLLINTILLPIILSINKCGVKEYMFMARIVQYVYLISAILLGCFLSLGVQDKADLVHIYMISVYSAVFFIILKPIENTIIIFTIYMMYFFLLPYFQHNNYVVTIIRTNTFIFNLFAIVLGNMIYDIKLRSFFDKKLLQENNIKLEIQTHKDCMTGLLNHTATFQTLEREMLRAKETKKPLSFVLIDIDNFKGINDLYGHQTGDLVITMISQLLISCVGEGDCIGRYGGDEFVIILPDSDLKLAESLFERIQEKVNEISFENNFKVSISGGLSQYNDETLKDFIKITDQKLYVAKRNGKNKFEK